MPELPEVETITRHLATLVGKTVVSVQLLSDRLFVAGNASDLVGATVVGARRYAKFIILDLTDNRSLTVHLNLAGQVRIDLPDGTILANGHPVPPYDAPMPHKSTRLIVRFADGTTVYLTDIRTFAKARLMSTPETDAFLAATRRGPDAHSGDITAEQFADRLAKRGRVVIKNVLLDQAFIAGVGNIYADEALWLTPLSPLTPANQVTHAQAVALFAAVRAVLNEAVTNGVAAVRNHRAIPGAALPRVHAHEGDPCPRCQTPIRRIVISNRSAYFCPVCQPTDEEGLAARTPTARRSAPTAPPD